MRKNYGRAREVTDENITQHCILLAAWQRQENRNMLIIFNTYCFSTASMVKRTRLKITLHILWLSFSISFYISPHFKQLRKISYKEVKSKLSTECKLKYILIWSLWVQFPLGKKTLSSHLFETTKTEMYKNNFPIFFSFSEGFGRVSCFHECTHYYSILPYYLGKYMRVRTIKEIGGFE